MSELIERIKKTTLLIKDRAGAIVAVVLIILALIIGYRIGRLATPPAASESSAHAADPGAAPQMYTCSMHPAVRLPDPDAKCPICFMDMIPVSAGDGPGSDVQLVLSDAAAMRSEIEVAKVGRFYPTAEVRLYGKLTYDETSVSRITAYFPGRIDRLFVNYIGVPVAKGDHIAELYSPDLLVAIDEVRQARQSVRESRTTNDLIRRTTERTLSAAREKLRLLGLTAEQILAAENGDSEGDRLTIFSPIEGIVTHLVAREGDYVETGSQIATVADLSRLWLDMEAYESQLPLLRWGLPVTFTVEAHPGEQFEGRIAFIKPLVDARTRTATVRIAVDNTNGRLKPGMFASAVAYPRVAAKGVVVSDDLAGLWVSPMHPTIVKDAPGQCDICGMEMVSAETFGVVGDPLDAEAPLVIPRTAALLTGKRAVVYVKAPGTENPTYEAREINLGLRAGEYYIVLDGLEEGEEVVVHGAFRIDSAMQIAAKPSMMSPGGGSSGAGHQHGGQVSMPTNSSSNIIPEHFLSGLMPVYLEYLNAQEALAADDLGGFIRAAGRLDAASGKVNESGLIGDSLSAWRKEMSMLKHERPVTTIDDARQRFEHMSISVIRLQRQFGHRGNETWSVAHCPMAFDFKGAQWMQRGIEINNPYFGSTMLRCGEIRESFEPDGMTPTMGHEGHDND